MMYVEAALKVFKSKLPSKILGPVRDEQNCVRSFTIHNLILLLSAVSGMMGWTCGSCGNIC